MLRHDGTQIFCDAAMLAQTGNAGAPRSIHSVKHRDNPVLVPDRSWEGYLVLQPGTVIWMRTSIRSASATGGNKLRPLACLPAPRPLMRRKQLNPLRQCEMERCSETPGGLRRISASLP